MSDRTKDQSAEPREWLIRKRGYYYRPNRAGYTAAVAEAGRYTEAEAKNEAALDPWHMTALHQSEVDAGCTVTSKTDLYKAALQRISAHAHSDLQLPSDSHSAGFWEGVARGLSLIAKKALSDAPPVETAQTSSNLRAKVEALDIHPGTDYSFEAVRVFRDRVLDLIDEYLPDETTTPRVTPVEVERLIDWHRMAAGVTEQTDDFVGARMHRERLRVWEAYRRGSPVEPTPKLLGTTPTGLAVYLPENGSEYHNKG